MVGCCNPRGCDRMFTPRFARLVASRYRKRGLGKTARTMVDLLPPADVQGATVLEIGGGVGEIQLELLSRGAASATNLELSAAYDAEAARLLAEAGLTGRVQRRIIDIAADPAGVPPADVVVLHRVVCCYPDYVALLAAAARHTRRHLVFSHPPRNPVSRAVVGTQNLLFRLAGREFRVFAHPPDAMLAVLADNGLRPAAARHGSVWQVALVTR